MHLYRFPKENTLEFIIFENFLKKDLSRKFQKMLFGRKLLVFFDKNLLVKIGLFGNQNENVRFIKITELVVV